MTKYEKQVLLRALTAYEKHCEEEKEKAEGAEEWLREEYLAGRARVQAEKLLQKPSGGAFI